MADSTGSRNYNIGSTALFNNSYFFLRNTFKIYSTILLEISLPKVYSTLMPRVLQLFFLLMSAFILSYIPGLAGELAECPVHFEICHEDFFLKKASIIVFNWHLWLLCPVHTKNIYYTTLSSQNFKVSFCNKINFSQNFFFKRRTVFENCSAFDLGGKSTFWLVW